MVINAKNNTNGKGFTSIIIQFEDFSKIVWLTSIVKYITRMPGKPTYRQITMPKYDPEIAQNCGDS